MTNRIGLSSQDLDVLIRETLSRARLTVGASEESVVAATRVAPELPGDYLAFLRASDGAEGWIGENYVQIMPARQAAETTQGFSKFVPGLFFFASDGAEALFAFDMRSKDRAVVITHTDDLDFDGLVRAADSFTAFLRFLHRTKWIGFWSGERARMESTD
jgi:hypothetical protein